MHWIIVFDMARPGLSWVEGRALKIRDEDKVEEKAVRHGRRLHGLTGTNHLSC